MLNRETIVVVVVVVVVVVLTVLVVVFVIVVVVVVVVLVLVLVVLVLLVFVVVVAVGGKQSKQQCIPTCFYQGIPIKHTRNCISRSASKEQTGLARSGPQTKQTKNIGFDANCVIYPPGN